ncbi:MAG TPA: LLM class flavin-dependent oxidoreductase [Stellaceae bacterium]|nr:LLM class flavin-dependent oxidoreductase [Stellaceae bacterium]
MEFGVFDHVDRNGMPLDAFYEMRLKIAEAYDDGGFRSYHIAEHHSTPVGMAPSPGMFLAAVAQRTRRLRFGPLVYLLPLYHPLRLVEEICMLDQMSRGRLELGVGRGVSPIEVGFYGVKPDDRAAMHAEALAVVKAGLTQKSVDFSGRFYKFSAVPMELEPYQKPMPPIWVGVERPDGAERAARDEANAITAHPVADAKRLYDAYRAAFADAHGGKPLPRIGLARFIVVAESDDAALAVARRAYPKWQASLTHLPRTYGVPTQNPRPPDFDAIRHGGRGIAGSPATVAAELKAQLAEAGANYCVGQFAFGDQTLAEVQRTIALFTREVMPALA